jgi:hypothetical protein
VTTQIGVAGGRTFATASVAATTALTDSGGGFTAADAGRVIATANVPAGTRISSVTNPGLAVMSAAATGTSGPQSCVLSPFFANAAFDASGRTLKTGPVISALPAAAMPNGLRACNEWHNAAGAGAAGIDAANVGLAVGVALQEI